MRRRDFVAMLGGAVTAWPISAQGQQQPGVRRIPIVGFIGLASTAVDSEAIVPFRKTLSELGYIEGRTIVIEERNAEGNVERAPVP
jgi:putative tryptophan/tyrosine transport system substrate-binding protein